MAKKPAKTKRLHTQTVELEPIAPDGGYGWVVLIAAFLISFIVDGCMYSFGIISPKIQDHFKITQEEVNLITSLYTGFIFLSGPVVAGLAKALGVRALAVGGGVVMALMLVASTYAPNISVMYICYGVVGGVATGCLYIGSLIITSQYFDKKIGVATGICMSGSGFGSFSFPPLTNYVLEHYDWKVMLLVTAGLIALAAGLSLLFKPAQEIEGQQNIVNIAKDIVDVKLLGQNVRFLFIALCNFFCFNALFIPYIYIKIHCGIIGLSDNETGLVYMVIGITNIPMRLFLGWFADQGILSAVNLNTMCIAVASLSVFIVGQLTNFWSMIAFAVIFASGTAGMNCLANPYINEVVGRAKFSNALGIVNLFRGIACFFGPYVGGKIQAAASGYHVTAFYFSALCFALGALMSLVVALISVCKSGQKKEAKPTEDEVTQLNDPTNA